MALRRFAGVFFFAVPSFVLGIITCTLFLCTIKEAPPQQPLIPPPTPPSTLTETKQPSPRTTAPPPVAQPVAQPIKRDNSGLANYCDVIDAINKKGGNKFPVLEDVLHILGATLSDTFRYIHIGAHVGGVNGSHDATMELTKKYGWNGLLVEPNPFIFQELHKTYQDWPNIYFAQVGIGDEDKMAPFWAVSGDIDPRSGKDRTGGRDRLWYVTQMSTFDPHLGPKRARSIPMKKLQVQLLTFKSLVEKHPVKDPHYILIDTEGYDWKVLSTVDLTVLRPLLVMFEYNKLHGDFPKAKEKLNLAGYHTTHRDKQDEICWRACTDDERQRFPGLQQAQDFITKWS